MLSFCYLIFFICYFVNVESSSALKRFDPSAVVRNLYAALLSSSTIGGGSIAIATGPTNTQFMNETFEPTVVGRSVPLGTFDTLDLVKLYFFASASSATNCSNIDIVELTVTRKENGLYTGWIYAVFTFQDNAAPPPAGVGSLATNGGAQYNVLQFGRFVFSDRGLIQSFDLVTPQQQLSYGFALEGTLPYTIAGTICGVHEFYCQAFPQFTLGTTGNVQDSPCYQYYSAAITAGSGTGPLPLGNFDQGDEDTLVCRYYALTYITKGDAETYCPFIAQQGQNTWCTDRTLDEYQAATPRYAPELNPVYTTCSGATNLLSLALLVVVALAGFF